jgi:hypothetical protein
MSAKIAVAPLCYRLPAHRLSSAPQTFRMPLGERK